MVVICVSVRFASVEAMLVAIFWYLWLGGFVVYCLYWFAMLGLFVVVFDG